MLTAFLMIGILEAWHTDHNEYEKNSEKDAVYELL